MNAATRDIKYQGLIQTIRLEIIDGVYASGHRLPTRSEIGAKFGVGAATVQKALETLAQDGFVEARARAGTFVAERLPHLCNYGIAVPAGSRWSLVYKSVWDAAGIVNGEGKLRFMEYFTSREIGSRGPAAQLCQDVTSRRLGGLILIGPAAIKDLAGTPALEQQGMPRVQDQAQPETDYPSIFMDTAGSFVTRALQYFTARGRRRIAHIQLLSEITKRRAAGEALARSGVELRPYWMQSVSAGSLYDTVPNVINVLMQLEGDKRPDAMVVHDDNLVEHVATGLMAAGVKVPDEVEVVAHFNYPSPAPSVLPMKRLGFDCRVFLRKCIEVLDMQRRGETPPARTAVAAVFDDELEGVASGFSF
jgi:DNA-binding LacI/PurR family transcriptional regulator